MQGFYSKISILSIISAVLACLALIGYVGYLVTAQYRAQVALQDSQRLQLTQEIDRRANAVGYFFSAQVTGLKDLAEAREISIYFENKALGMSPEYGLNASLVAIQSLFDSVLQKTRLEQHQVYNRILFLTSDGQVLATSGAGGNDGNRSNWASYVRPAPERYFMTEQRQGSTVIIISLPCIFKEKVVGQVIGEIPLSLIYDHFIGNREGSAEVIALVMENRYLYLPTSRRNLLPLDLRGAPPRLPAGALTPLKKIGKGADEFLAIRAAIPETPVELFEFIPASGFDRRHPLRMLGITAGMAVVILTGIFILVVMMTRNTILKTRLEEAAIRERHTEEQNRLLQNEIGERQTAEERLNLALKGGDLGLWDWNMQTNRIEFNDRWFEMIEYGREELEGRIETFERFVHPEDREKVFDAVAQHAADSVNLYEVEYRLRTKSDDWRWFLAKGKIVEYDPQGQPLRMTGTQLDITERKRAEAALVEQSEMLEQLNRTLERRVQEEIEKSREKDLIVLQNEKLASIGQLAAGVAHEINNPMGFISSNLRTLTRYFSSLKSFIEAQGAALTRTAPPELLQELAATEKALDVEYVLDDGGELIVESLDGAKRVTQIVSDLKSFSRIDAPEYEEVDLTTCLESSLNIVSHEVRYTVTIVRETEPLPPVSCHPGQINQVFVNLLLNAAQAITPPGTITLKSWHDPGFVYVSVIDNGHGIPEEIRDRIFEPFFTSKDVGKGTGLGLSISYDIIKKHHGEILVESSPLGTTFTVKIPRTTEVGNG